MALPWQPLYPRVTWLRLRCQDCGVGNKSKKMVRLDLPPSVFCSLIRPIENHLLSLLRQPCSIAATSQEKKVGLVRCCHGDSINGHIWCRWRSHKFWSWAPSKLAPSGIPLKQPSENYLCCYGDLGWAPCDPPKIKSKTQH